MEVAYIFTFLLFMAVCKDGANQPPPPCENTNKYCEKWAITGECQKKNSDYMLKECCKACKGGQTCKDGDCWCVEPETGKEIPGTRRGPTQAVLDCDVTTTSVSFDPYNYEQQLDGNIATFSLGQIQNEMNNLTTDGITFDAGSGEPVFDANYPKRSGQATDGHRCDQITSVPTHLTFITRYNYYYRYTHAYNIPIVSSSRVSDAALKRACYVLRFLLADRRVLRKYLYMFHGRIGIIGRYEQTTGIPEHSWLPKWWDQRARGLGGTLRIPISTGTEENLLCERTDRYKRQDIFLHEFSHGIQEIAVRGGGIPGFYRRLVAAYNSAKSRGLWRRTYSMSTVQEYFAEGTQSYFYVNSYSPTANGVVGPINTRPKLKRYDPVLYNLIVEVFPCGNHILKRCDAVRGAAMLPFKMNCDGDGEEVTIGGPNPTKVTKVTGKQKTENPPRPPIPTVPKPTACLKDKSAYCAGWARLGYCSKGYVTHMMANCYESCGCCKDISKHCEYWATNGYCTSSKVYMSQNCKKSCQICQKLAQQNVEMRAPKQQH